MAQANKAALVPFLLKGVADGDDPTRLFQSDRIHPTGRGPPDHAGQCLADTAKAACHEPRFGERGATCCSTWTSFDTIIDARSEDEFALDHLPGAVNWPTLDNQQRHDVGSRYKQVNPFEARKLGAAIAARNIAAHIEREVMDKPRTWRPLVYCWRGGQRSGSLSLVLGQIGFRVSIIEGGYKAFRAAIVADTARLAGLFDYRVVCGTTGSGKTRLLHALARAGAQVLDLEDLANHRSSVLGAIPGVAQPSQKAFDTLVWDRLRRFDPARPVFVESESRKVGNVAVPVALMDAMRAKGQCLNLELPDTERVALADGGLRVLRAQYRGLLRPTRRLDRNTRQAGGAGLEGRRAVRGDRYGGAGTADAALRPGLPAVDAAQFHALWRGANAGTRRPHPRGHGCLGGAVGRRARHRRG